MIRSGTVSASGVGWFRVGVSYGGKHREEWKGARGLLCGRFGIGGQAIVADAAHFRAGYGDLDVAIA